MRGVGALGELRRWGGSPAATGILLAATGLSVWIGLSIVGGSEAPEPGFRLREAWDTSAYFYAGIPVMALAVAVAGFLSPHRIWRWPLWLVGGHQLGVLLVGVGMQSGLSLVILTIVLAVLLAAFFAIPAALGSLAARHLMERAY